MKPFFLLLAGGLVVFTLGTLALSRGEAVLNRADPENTDQVARGRLVYDENCASCHGANLQGQLNWRERKPDGRLPAPPHDDTGHTWHHADEQLFRITKNGVKPPLAPEGYESDMPAFAETLSDEDIWAVLSFIKSTWSMRSLAYQERIDKSYRKQAKQK
jgi:mono/diheme cytochrome c family protein